MHFCGCSWQCRHLTLCLMRHFFLSLSLSLLVEPEIIQGSWLATYPGLIKGRKFVFTQCIMSMGSVQWQWLLSQILFKAFQKKTTNNSWSFKWLQARITKQNLSGTRKYLWRIHFSSCFSFFSTLSFMRLEPKTPTSAFMGQENYYPREDSGPGHCIETGSEGHHFLPTKELN